MLISSLPVSLYKLEKNIKRGVCIFKRMYPPALYKEGRGTGPLRPKLKRREYVYILLEDTNIKKAGNMDVILAADVDGLGFQGDIVSISKPLARTQMLPVGVAVYCSPENLIKYEQIKKENDGKIRQTMSAHILLKQLEGLVLPIPMSSTIPWVLNKTHVKASLRCHGIVADENCLGLPADEITTPGNYDITITINNLNSVKVKIFVYHHSKTTLPSLPKIWSNSEEHKFNLEDVIASAALKLRTNQY